MSRIGYTTGVYDLFHIGHLNLLKSARELCDYLIVGVTTDELSLNRKGKVPVIPYLERHQIVAAVRHVDLAVPQESMDKFAAWEKYRFDVMFVGDDWKGTSQWNALELQFSEVDVEIVYLPYTHTTSSTLLKQTLEVLSAK